MCDNRRRTYCCVFGCLNNSSIPELSLFRLPIEQDRLWCETSSGCVLGGDALGRRGTDARTAGAQAAGPLRTALLSRTCFDAHMQDQVIIYMALAEGRSAIMTGEVTLHTKTAIHIAELIAKTKFIIQPEGDLNIIECTGLGLINKNMPPE